MTNERLDELLALAALGELTDAEEAELDRALADDAEIQRELDADLDTAAHLQQLAAEAPPATLRGNVLDAISGVEQEHDDPPVAPASSMSAARERRAARLWQPLLAAAAVITLAITGAILVNRGDDAPTFAEITRSDDAVAQALDGPLVGELSVVFSPGANAFALDGRDVAGVSAAETYQVWLVDESGATSLGLFQPDDDGRVMETFDDLDPTDFVVGVTVEPAGGSDQPTLPIVAST